MRNLLLFTVFTLMSAATFAQNATIRGFVYDKETGDASPFTNVLLDGTNYGVTTDVNGYFSINKIPAGTYTVIVSFVGYEKVEEEVTVKEGQIITRKFYMEEASEMLEEVEIDAEKLERKTEVRMSMVKATKREIAAVPTTGGEADIATYFQTVPGVVSTGDQGGQLYVRGGSPVQNKVLLDGMVIYNPFHSIGFFSVFDTDIIRNADIYTGGYGAEYGGRISSIMDITTRDGNRKEFSGKVSVNPFGSKLLLEGPLKKISDDGKSGSISYVLSGKTSYLEQSSKIFYSYVDTAGLPFNYTDLYGKISFNGKTGSKFNMFGFNFSDNVKWQAISDLKWNSYGGGMNFVLLPQGSPVLVQGRASYSNYEISLEEEDLAPRSSIVDGFNVGFDFKYFIRDNEIKYGIEVNGFKTDFTTFNANNRKLSQIENTTELAGYVSFKWIKGLWLVEPSLRGHYYASLRTFSPEPRLGIKFNALEDLRFKAAGGIYSQNLISAVSDRDVVNLFYGFLSGSNNLPKTYINENNEEVDRTHPLQKAVHAIFGFEYDVSNKIMMNVEGYYKKFTQLTNVNRNKLFEDTPGNNQYPDVLKKDFIIETGDAYGVDFVTKYTTDRTYIWFVYSLQKVNRWDGFQEYSPVFDRRHNINLVATQLLGKDDQWEISVRWNLGSGLPFTQTNGFYQRINFSDGVATDYTTSNSDEISVIYGDLNTGRLPYYHRLDLSVKRVFEMKNDQKLEVNAGATNVYNRDNVFYVNRVKNDVVYQLPLLPSIGLKWSF